jgi:hypothetical protein
LVINPVSTPFVPDVRPVWREASRVLAPGGSLLAGLTNPVNYLFDFELVERGVLEVRYTIPYSDLNNRAEAELRAQLAQQEPVEYGHTLEDLIGGQLDAGLVITGFYEDVAPDDAISARKGVGPAETPAPPFKWISGALDPARGILLVQIPPQAVVQYVFADPRQLPFASDDVIEVASLPDGFCQAGSPSEASHRRFIGPHDRRERTRHRFTEAFLYRGTAPSTCALGRCAVPPS